MITSMGRYALLIMCCISRLEGESPVSKKVIAGELGISYNYVEQILTFLKRSGFVVSVLGIRGGFRLAKEESEISVYDVLEAVEGDSSLIASLKEGRSLSDTLVTQSIWQGASDLLQEYFSGITLKELLKK